LELRDAEGLVKEFGDGGLFSRVVIAELFSLVIRVRYAVEGAFVSAEQALSRHIWSFRGLF